MTENKRPLDQALDLFVYAPIGLALSAREELPRLADRGRQQLDAQLTMARMVGQFALGEAGRRLEKLTSPPPPPRPERAAAPAPAAATPTAPRTTRAPAAPATNGNGSGPSAEALAIHGYDALAASQVVQRLAGLSREELEAVRAYEAATRGRKTILNRVQQLQSDSGT